LCLHDSEKPRGPVLEAKRAARETEKRAVGKGTAGTERKEEGACI
jgi:hypothetical protein